MIVGATAIACRLAKYQIFFNWIALEFVTKFKSNYMEMYSVDSGGCTALWVLQVTQSGNRWKIFCDRIVVG